MLELLALAAPAAVAAERPATPPAKLRRPKAGQFLFLPKGNPWLAAGLSLGVTGLGQAYNGEGEKGLGMAAPLLLVPAAWGLDVALQRGVLRTFAFGLNAGLKVWSVADAAGNAWEEVPASAVVLPR